MIMDKRLEFSESQELTASAASTNHVDLGVAGDAVNELQLVVQVDQASDSADNGETVTAKLQSDDNASFSSPKDETAAVVVAQVAAGKTVFKGRIPRGCQRYLRMYYTVGGTALTANAKVSAFLTDGVQGNDLSNG
jgi:hypothetical protein